MLKPKEPSDTWSGAEHADIIAQWGKMRLVRYEARGPRRHPVPILIVTPLMAKPYVLDLAPGLSLVSHLAERGLELFLVDFGVPDSQDRQLRFEDHLRVIDLAMNKLLAQTGAKRATLLGYCLGGIFATVYAATYLTNVHNLVTWRPRSTSPGPARCTGMSAPWMLMAWSTDWATSRASGSETRFGQSRR
jgi:polyhydroxyalkanoate synthase